MAGMVSRTTVVACLVAIELAVAGEMVVAVRAFHPLRSIAGVAVPDSSGGDLVEDGPHRRFAAPARPVLYVDVGYADLTIRTGDAANFDVSLAASTSRGLLRSRGPIAARLERDALHVAIARTEPWTSGDDRTVTVVAPPQTRIVVRNAGNIDARGLRAEASFHSLAHGVVRVDDYDADDLRVAATDGPITLTDVVATRLEISTGDGRIRGRALRVRDGTIASEDGAVALAFAPGADTSVAAETDGGAVRVAGALANAPLRLGAGEGRLDVRSSADIDLTP